MQNPYQSKFYHRSLKEGAITIFLGWLIEFRRFLYPATIFLVLLELSQMGSRVIISEILTRIQLQDWQILAILIAGILPYDMLVLGIDILFTKRVILGIGYDVSYALERKVLEHVTSLGHTFFTSFPVSKTLDRIEKIDRIAELIAQGFWNMLNNLVQVVISMAVLLVYAPAAVPIVLVCLFVFFSINSTLISKQRPARRRRKDWEESKSELIMRLVAANITLLNNDALSRYLGMLPKYQRSTKKAGSLELSYNLKGTGVFRDVALFAGRRAVLALAVFLTMNKVIDIPRMVLVYTVAETMFIGFWGVVRFVQSFVYEIPSILKLEELMKIQPTIVEPENPQSIPDAQVAFDFADVSFTYKPFSLTEDEETKRDTKHLYTEANARRSILGLPHVSVNSGKKEDVPQPHLCNINLSIAPGEKLAIVGQSGSGKTTITHLFSKLQLPDSGRIFVNGVDLTQVNGGELRKLIGIVPQGSSVYLLNDTLRENITLGDPAFTDDDVEEALRVAELWDFVQKKMPLLYWTEIGERGMTLSGGQQQRVAIARVAIRKPKMIILDEATSALDNRTEKLIQRSLDHLMKGRTSVIIAHRLSTIQNADRIVVMKEGQIVGIGKYEELMAQNSHFLELANPKIEEEDEV